MKLSAIILARVVGYVETFDLSPRGKVHFPDVVQALVARYEFQKFPVTPEQFDEQNGVEFFEGKSGDTVIQKLTIYNSLLVIDTRAGTDDSKRILEEMLQWGTKQFGLNYKQGMIERFAYVSNVSFFSEAPLLLPSVAIAELAAKTGKLVSRIWNEDVKYEGINIQIGHDPLSRKYGIAPFSITRRAEHKFSENKYFSEAPLPTDTHLQLLEEFEKRVVTENAPMAAEVRQGR